MITNLSSSEFLNQLDVKLCTIRDEYKKAFEQTNIALQSASVEDAVKILHSRSLIIKAVSRVENNIRNNQTMYAARRFQESKYGLTMVKKSGRTYHTVYRNTGSDNIQGWLFDFVGDDRPTQGQFKDVLASDYIRYYENGGINQDEAGVALYEAAKFERKQELKKCCGVFGWTDQHGLSCYNPKMFWLFTRNTNLKKINGVVDIGKKDVKFHRNVETWMGITYKLSGEFSNHRFPKGWVMGDNEIIYPRSYAMKKRIVIVGASVNSPVYDIIGLASGSNYAFSHRYGYYNSTKFESYKGGLYHKADFVTTNDGKRVPKEQARFVERHNSWFVENQTVQIHTGKCELRQECRYYNGSWYHNDENYVQTCPLCSNVDLTERFVYIDGSDQNSTLVCSSCNSNLSNQLHRLCYSTDVIDHKGFGTSPFKINGEPVYLGLELETYADYNDENQRDVYRALNAFAASDQNYTVPTRDGSLDGSHGVEYIFRPEGLVNQKRNVNHFISKLGDYLVEDAGNGYGLHIHVSDHFLTQADKVRIDNFVSMNEKYFRAIGGRAETEYQVKKAINSNKGLKTSLNSKYKMVNIGRSGTIEYRFPKSLVNEVHISMNLEMAQALTLYCKYHLSSAKLDTRSEKAVALKGFIDYVSTNKKTYPLLNAENNANIKLDKLESYSEFCKKAIKAKKESVDVYTLAA